MNELRQRSLPLDELENMSEKDDFSALHALIRQVIQKKYNNRHFRRRAVLYLGSFLVLSVYLVYSVVLALQCESSELAPAFLGDNDHEYEPVYFLETAKRGAAAFENTRERDFYIKRYKVDKMRSDSLPLNRQLADYRPDVCKIKPYRKTGLTISVIIVLDTAPPSVVLRTIYSVISRTKSQNLAEIIVCSQKGSLDITEYVYAYELSHLVRVITSPLKRSLSSARNEAARYARGDVLVFIPEASEILPAWAEPLLEAMSQNPATLAGFSMDEINGETFAQMEHVPWHLISLPRWDYVTAVPIEIPQHEQKRRQTFPYPDASPVRTPVLQFLPWAAGREYFLKIGGLDEGMLGTRSVVPGDLLELSLRWWSCHGEVVYLPCSKVAYLTLLEDKPGLQTADNTLYNSRRTAARWGAQYMQYYLEAVPKAKHQPASQSTKLDHIISALSCQSLHWFITQVAVDWNYGNKLLRKGAIKAAHGNKCVDTMGHDGRYSPGRPEFYSCHGGHSQFLVYLTSNKQIRTETGKCLMGDHYWHDVLTLDYCGEGHQWRWEAISQGSNRGYLIYKDLCLEYRPENSLLFYVPCKQSPDQQFIFEVDLPQ